MSDVEITMLFLFLEITYKAVFVFFFSSRRRHTRWTGDWSQTCALPILHASLPSAPSESGPHAQTTAEPLPTSSPAALFVPTRGHKRPPSTQTHRTPAAREPGCGRGTETASETRPPASSQSSRTGSIVRAPPVSCAKRTPLRQGSRRQAYR